MTKSCTAYPKEAFDRKGGTTAWPSGRDTAAEEALKAHYVQAGLSEDLVDEFRQLVYGYAHEHRRNLPWRQTVGSWPVLVSEVMLQQTQVERVVPRFIAFMVQFPCPASLAAASLSVLLESWQGLGYNRRALNLQRAAQQVVTQWGGRLSDDPLELRQLPGIGPYTAGAIAAFAFNQPAVFLETNIRAVLLHLFFAGQQGVTDTQLLPFVTAVLDQANPRSWYNALMDYGSDLKRRFPNPSRRSLHHTVQSRFEGSDRQIRGALLRLLLEVDGMTAAAIGLKLAVNGDRLQRILDGMLQEGFVVKRGRRYLIPAT